MKALSEGEMVVRRINRGRMPHLFWQTQPDKRRFRRGQGVMRIGVFQNVKPEGAFFGNIFIMNLSYLL